MVDEKQTRRQFMLKWKNGIYYEELNKEWSRRVVLRSSFSWWIIITSVYETTISTFSWGMIIDSSLISTSSNPCYVLDYSFIPLSSFTSFTISSARINLFSTYLFQSVLNPFQPFRNDRFLLIWLIWLIWLVMFGLFIWRRELNYFINKFQFVIFWKFCRKQARSRWNGLSFTRWMLYNELYNTIVFLFNHIIL